MRSDGTSCGPPLVDYDGLSLYSLSVSKLRPHLFVVAGTAPYAFLHDRRMLRKPMQRDWGIEANADGLTQCVRRFGVPNADGSGEVSSSLESLCACMDTADRPTVPQITKHVVATKLSATHARDLLVSYSGAGVFLFDTDADPLVKPTPVPKPTGKRRRHHAEDEHEQSEPAEDDGEGEPTSLVPEKRPRQELESPAIGPHLHEAAEAADEEEGVPSASESSDEEEDEEEAGFSRLGRLRSYHPDVPLVAPRREYTGHLNESTVKDVNFAFGDEFVVSGSDDGHFFVWEKEREELLGIFKGDDSGAWRASEPSSPSGR